MQDKTREQEVREYLNQHGSITSLEAIKTFTNTRLAATIFNLREAGLKIKSVWESNVKRRWVRYSLEVEKEGEQIELF